MTDVVKYLEVKSQAKKLFMELKDIRQRIRLMEQQMVDRLKSSNQSSVSVVVHDRPATLRVMDRTRRVPLTESDLKERLRDCLMERFKDSTSEQSINEFAVSMGSKIWSTRRIKREEKLSLKMKKPS